MSHTARQNSQGVFADIARIFALQQAQQWVTKSTSAEQRKAKLGKLKSAVEAHSDEIVAAVKLDTRKPENEIRVTELLNVIANIERNINNLDDWMKPVEVPPSQNKNDKAKLDYPGGVGRVAQAVDADLLARAIAWSGESEKARNEIFNVTNGDVFVWPNVWPAIADALGFEAGVHVPLRLDTQIRLREDEWAAIRKAHGLRSGTLKEFVGLSFEYADHTMGYGRDTPGPAALVSTIKLMQAGFHEVMDTEAMFRKCFAEMQAKKLLPPR